MTTLCSKFDCKVKRFKQESSDRQTDTQTDGRTDGRTDATNYIISLASRSIIKEQRKFSVECRLMKVYYQVIIFIYFFPINLVKICRWKIMLIELWIFHYIYKDIHPCIMPVAASVDYITLMQIHMASHTCMFIFTLPRPGCRMCV